MIERGVNEREANAITEAARNEDFFEDDPEDSADDELSYWASDG